MSGILIDNFSLEVNRFSSEHLVFILDTCLFDRLSNIVK